MRQGWRTVAIRVGLLLVATAAGPAWAQKPGGILKMQHWDSPASMSIHEEATYSVVVPMMVRASTRFDLETQSAVLPDPRATARFRRISPVAARPAKVC
jgi:hypothetical protein